MDENRAPCITCKDCPTRPVHWREGTVSVGCRKLSTCKAWENWFLTDGWKSVCAPLRALKRRRRNA